MVEIGADVRKVNYGQIIPNGESDFESAAYAAVFAPTIEERRAALRICFEMHPNVWNDYAPPTDQEFQDVLDEFEHYFPNGSVDTAGLVLSSIFNPNPARKIFGHLCDIVIPFGDGSKQSEELHMRLNALLKNGADPEVIYRANCMLDMYRRAKRVTPKVQ